jgi:hypothetical protein
MAHAEFWPAVRRATRDRAARPARTATIAPFPKRPLPPRQTPFPELDAVRGRVDAGLLAWAERRAAALGTGVDRVLIAAEVLAEDDYLRAFSAATGIRFLPLDHVSRAACPISDERLLDAAAAGILPIRIGRDLVLAVAPRGTGARSLTQRAAINPALIPRLAVISESALQRFVIRHCTAPLGERAAEGLRTASPMLSAARRPQTTGRWRAAVLAAAAAAFAVTQPTAAFGAIDIGLSVLFLGWAGLRLFCPFVGRNARAQRMPVRPADLPVYTVIAALYQEAVSVSDLVAALRLLDWPAEKLDVKLVIESDDTETRAAIDALALDPRFEIIVAPAVGPRTKPKALNAALPFARGTFTVIYDAEDRPEPEQLRVALDAFLADNHELACVQAALTIDNTADSLLTRWFTIEYAAQFDVFLPSLARLGAPLPLGGSSNHFRTDALRAIGGWDPYNVTEDADLGVRLARFGYRSSVIASTTYEEAPACLRPWVRQRTRWFKGWLQTWLVQMRAPHLALQDLGPGGFTAFHLVIGGNVLAALVYPPFLALVAWRLATGAPAIASGIGWLHIAALAAGLVATCATGIAGLRRRNLLTSRCVGAVLLAPLHWGLLSYAAWRALLQLLRDPHRWEKTEHGLARSSRREGPPSRVAPTA